MATAAKKAAPATDRAKSLGKGKAAEAAHYAEAAAAAELEHLSKVTGGKVS